MTRLLRGTLWLTFLTLGFSLSVTGPLVPAIQAGIAMSYLQSGLVISGQFLGIVLTTPFLGPVADRYGKGRLVIGSAAFSAAGLLAYAAAGSFPALFLASVITGVGTGGFVVGGNGLQADHASGAGGSMNLLHFFFGVGAILGPLLAALVVGVGGSWRLVFAGLAVLPVTVGVLAWSQHIGPPPPRPHDAPGGVYRSRALWLTGLALAAYVGLETSMYGWIATYWAQRGDPALFPGPILASLFWAVLTAGRVALAPMVDRVGLVRFVRSAAAATLLLTLLWTAWPSPATTLCAVVLVGLTLSAVYPTAMAFATGAFPGDSGKVVALVSVCSSLGGFTLPSAIGRLADGVGFGVFPPALAALALLMVAAMQGVRFESR